MGKLWEYLMYRDFGEHRVAKCHRNIQRTKMAALPPYEPRPPLTGEEKIIHELRTENARLRRALLEILATSNSKQAEYIVKRTLSAGRGT